ncbi:MAG TPA: hypothetical protein VEN78_39070 [Bradyrhizobium sp.]|nr:hypothetical protein [Bradyrhizobium sp.]
MPYQRPGIGDVIRSRLRQSWNDFHNRSDYGYTLLVGGLEAGIKLD